MLEQLLGVEVEGAILDHNVSYESRMHLLFDPETLLFLCVSSLNHNIQLS